MTEFSFLGELIFKGLQEQTHNSKKSASEDFKLMFCFC